MSDEDAIDCELQVAFPNHYFLCRDDAYHGFYDVNLGEEIAEECPMNWTDLNDNRIRRWSDLLTFARINTFRFALPAFIRHALKYPLEIASHSLICNVSRKEGGAHWQSRVSALNQPQQLLLYRFMLYVSKHEEFGIGKDVAAAALDDYLNLRMRKRG